MKRLITVLVLVAGSAFLASPATAQPASLASAENDQVCPDLSTGKIDAGGTDATLTITAPEGFLIDYYCVKAGSAQQGDGPEIVQVNPPAESVVISHSSGKGISHYSVHYIKEETPETPNTPKTPADKTSTPGEEGVLPATGGDDLGLLLLAGVLGTAGVLTLASRRFMH